MKGYKINDGNKYYSTPWERDEVLRRKKHEEACTRSRRNKNALVLGQGKNNNYENKNL